MRLIITRHGETEENKKKLFQGQTGPGKLSAIGIEQAQKLSQRLQEEKIDVIYSSDLERAADTAKEIAKYHPHTPLVFVKELRERNVGEWEGKPHAEATWDKPREAHNITQVLTKQGESLVELQNRARKCIDMLIHNHRNKTVVLVAHNGINTALMSVIMQQPPEAMPEFKRQRNTAVTIVEIDEDKNHRILLSNCTDHLTK
ncbi:MAG: histidine phosphatase family protein [Candidatus Woesearchaeota archaeon]|nr:histidine phosphatase family protein [Candidatus Woesearchaeota archaeon]